MKLWRYNPTIGNWALQRQCDAETASEWLQVFSRDEPKASFRLSEKQPQTAPDGRKLPRLVNGRYMERS